MKFSETYDEAMQPMYGTTRWAHYYLGAPTGATTPAQLQEITKLANTGMMNVEIGSIDPSVWEAIPKQHFEEARRLAKLSGVKPSVHAPIIDLSGFGEERWGGEEERMHAEEMMKDVVDKAAELTVEGQPVPITMHGSRFPSKTTTWDEKEKKEIVQNQTFVNPVTGEVAQFKREERFYPGEEKKWKETAQMADERNFTQWDSTLRAISDADKEAKLAAEKLGEIEYSIRPLEVAEKAGVLPKEQEQKLNHLKQEREAWASRMHLFEQHFESAAATSFDNMYKSLKAVKDDTTNPEFKHMWKATEAFQEKLKEEVNKKKREERESFKVEQTLNFMNNFQQIGAQISKGEEHWIPPAFIPVEQFVKKEASETISDLAWYGYKKFKEKAPIISIENWHPSLALSRGEELKEALKEARKKFVDKAQKAGISAGEASAAAEKLIGATWDVGHLNLLQKYGYDKKKIVEETAKIAQDVKHVHLTDNFGFSDVHLPPGMGNVPFEEIAQELQKAGKMGKVRGIVEAAAFPQHFKTDPHIPTLEYFQSPVYGWQTSPTWAETAGAYFFGSGGYVGGYGDTLPSRHWSEYGAGFSQLPTALGGVTPGEKSKFAGTPMA